MGGRIILLADDEVLIREGIGALLEGAGYRVLLAGDAYEMLELARRRRPDLLILDLIMPGLPYQEVLATLAGEAELSEIPVLLITGMVSLNDKMLELAEKYELLQKPFPFSELADRIEQLLAGGPDK